MDQKFKVILSLLTDKFETHLGYMVPCLKTIKWGATSGKSWGAGQSHHKDPRSEKRTEKLGKDKLVKNDS